MKPLLPLLLAFAALAQPLSVVQEDERDFLLLMATIFASKPCEPETPTPVSRHNQRRRSAGPAFRRLLQAELDLHNNWVRHCHMPPGEPYRKTCPNLPEGK